MPSTTPTGAIANFVHQGTYLPEPVGLDWDQCTFTYQEAGLVAQAAWLIQGFAASCVTIKYGQQSLQEFAREVDATYETVRQQRRVYMKLMGLENGERIPILEAIRTGALKYSHLLVANKLEKDEYVATLNEAHDNGYTTRRLGEEVAVRHGAIDDTEPQQEEQGKLFHMAVCPRCGGEGKIKVRGEEPE